MKKILSVCGVALSLTLSAEVVIDATGTGRELIPVSIAVGDAEFAKCLKKNLELTGVFSVGGAGTVKVSGSSGAVQATGGGRTVAVADVFTDAKSARMAARKLSNAMCEAYGNQKGFALDRLAFVNKKGPNNAELCMCYPDGYDIRQVTSDGVAAVGPRWKDATTLYYTGFLNGAPQIFELNPDTGARKLKWSPKGLATGACVSPDGSKVAIIMSFQGNPELYVIDLATSKWARLTNTKTASEGQPAWSPDGKEIVYVSDETRHPQLYVVDVATRSKRRLTSKGTQNVDPDWGRDGRIAYITKRGGLAQVAVMDPKVGESSVQLVTAPGGWEHPSWARDARHVVAGRDKAMFVIDAELPPDGTCAKPRQVFFANGNWTTPSWSK